MSTWSNNSYRNSYFTTFRICVINRIRIWLGVIGVSTIDSGKGIGSSDDSTTDDASDKIIFFGVVLSIFLEKTVLESELDSEDETEKLI